MYQLCLCSVIVVSSHSTIRASSNQEWESRASGATNAESFVVSIFLCCHEVCSSCSLSRSHSSLDHLFSTEAWPLDCISLTQRKWSCLSLRQVCVCRGTEGRPLLSGHVTRRSGSDRTVLHCTINIICSEPLWPHTPSPAIDQSAGFLAGCDYSHFLA